LRPDAAGSGATAHDAAAQQCADPYSGTRDPANPLGLATPPGADPLSGARFFVPGPAHGAAAGAIASLVGLKPSHLSDGESWAAFSNRLHSGRIGQRLKRKHGLAHRVNELSKIASEAEVQRISAYSFGGTASGVFLQTEKILCHNLTSDPGSIPILNTYFLHPAAGQCPSPGALSAASGLFKRRVDDFVEAVERRPALLLLETDAVGTSSCAQRHGSLGIWESLLKYEIDKVAALPHVVAYVEGGYSDANSVGYATRILNAADIGRIRGFYTNDTHLNWTAKEVRYATAISHQTGGAHFIVNTAQNGRGPKLNRHPRSQGIEDLCNPPGRGLGPRPTTNTGFALGDAFLWTSPPGNSSGCGGGPSAGKFWAARGVGLAERANGKLGPGYPSRPY
jgi:endoglucanase